jgi:hypothetical protein
MYIYTESSIIEPSDYFEAMPGKITNFAKVKRPTVLFDRFSMVWRAGSVGSSERVLASMKNMQSSSFSDVSLENDHVEEGRGDEGGVMDEGEMEGDEDGDDTGKKSDRLSDYNPLTGGFDEIEDEEDDKDEDEEINDVSDDGNSDSD